MREAAEEAQRTIDFLQSYEIFDQTLLDGIEALNKSMAEAVELRKLADAHVRAEAARQEAIALYDMAIRLQDEDDVVALLLS